MTGLSLKSEWLKGLIDFVFPPLCLGCGEYTENDHSVCDACLEGMDPFEQPFCLTCMNMIPSGNRCSACGDEALILYAYGNYTGPLEQVIIQFKFKGISRPSRLFAAKVAEGFGDYIKSIDKALLVPIPLHPTRENRRGYNQAGVLAGHLSEILGIESRDDILVRTEKRRPQARLNHHERAINIRDVYEVEDLPDNSPSILLVDDVVTSGATVREAARALREAGLNVAGVISIAHAL